MKKILSAIAFLALMGVSNFNQNAMAFDLDGLLEAFEARQPSSKGLSIAKEFEYQVREYLPYIFRVIFLKGIIQEGDCVGITLSDIGGLSLKEETVFNCSRRPYIRVSGFTVCSAKTNFDKTCIYKLCASITLSNVRSRDDVFWVDEFNLSIKGTEIEASSKGFQIEGCELTGKVNLAIQKALTSIGIDQLVLEIEIELIPTIDEGRILRSGPGVSPVEVEREITLQTRQALIKTLTDNAKLAEDNRKLKAQIEKEAELRRQFEELERKYASLNARFEKTILDKVAAQKEASDVNLLAEGLKQEAKLLRQYREDMENELENLRLRIKEMERELQTKQVKG